MGNIVGQYHGFNHPASSRGFGALAYILMSIALLAAITSAMTIITRNSSRAQQTDTMVAQIFSQAAKIRADILLCMTEVSNRTSGVGPSDYQRFPSCNGRFSNGQPQVGACTSQATDSSITYGTPNYCSQCGSSSEIYANARTLRCLSPSSRSVWDTTQGDFYPEAINGYEEWKYSIQGAGAGDLKGVFISISAATRAANMDTDFVMRSVARRFGTVESRLAIRKSGTDGNKMDPSAFTTTNISLNSTCNVTTGANCANTVIIFLAR